MKWEGDLYYNTKRSCRQHHSSLCLVLDNQWQGTSTTDPTTRVPCKFISTEMCANFREYNTVNYCSYLPHMYIFHRHVHWYVYGSVDYLKATC